MPFTKYHLHSVCWWLWDDRLPWQNGNEEAFIFTSIMANTKYSFFLFFFPQYLDQLPPSSHGFYNPTLRMTCASRFNLKMIMTLRQWSSKRCHTPKRLSSNRTLQENIQRFIMKKQQKKKHISSLVQRTRHSRATTSEVCKQTNPSSRYIV